MRRLCGFVLLFAISSLSAEPPEAPSAKGELKTLQGVWLFGAVEGNGVKVTPDDAKWVVEDNKYTTKVGTDVQEGTITIDATKSPKWIDLFVTSGKGKGLTYHGIYKIVDDELLWCFPNDQNGKRPTEFSGSADSGQTLSVLKRKKP